MIRRAVPLALGLLSVSNPQISVMDTLSKLSHDHDVDVAQGAILALGLIGAGMHSLPYLSSRPSAHSPSSLPRLISLCLRRNKQRTRCRNASVSRTVLLQGPQPLVCRARCARSVAYGQGYNHTQPVLQRPYAPCTHSCWRTAHCLVRLH